MKKLLILFLISITSLASAKDVIFYYEESPLKRSEILKLFVKEYYLTPSRLEYLEKRSFVMGKTKTMNGKKFVGIKINQEALDLTKLKAYYLQVEGGDHYSETLYNTEFKRNRIADSYNDYWIYKGYYSVIPLSKNTGNSSSTDFNSNVGATVSAEYRLQSIDRPLFFYGALTFRKWSNINAEKNITTTKNKITYGPQDSIDFRLLMGLTPRFSHLRYFGGVEKLSSKLTMYNPYTDQIDMIDDDRYFASFGARYTFFDKLFKDHFYFEGAILASPQDDTALGMRLDASYIFKKHYFFNYEFQYVHFGKDLDADNYNHVLNAGFAF